ncbi:MAG: DNA polymerase I [Parvibaculaceae bacterium]|nr:DNA polymerase I [Parvibaculaceae bacterium]
MTSEPTSSQPQKKQPGTGDHVVLVDGSGYIFRAYHALPPLTRKSDGLPIGAVSGFCNMLYKLLEDTRGEDEATHLAVIFDAKGKTFRSDIYPEYKAHRPPAPEDLVPQFALIREAVEAFGVPSIEMAGYEADDLIATYATRAAAQGARVTIISSDKDLMQLVTENVHMLDTMKNRHIDAEGVFEKFGVTPDKVIDVQSLAGDSVDNVPGVPGIGIKTAALLINEYGDLETLLTRAEEIKQKKRRENLIEFADLARVSQKLVRLAVDVPTVDDMDGFCAIHPDPVKLIGFTKAMELATLSRRLGAHYGVDPEAVPANGGPEKGTGEEAIPSLEDVAAKARSAEPGGALGAIPDGLTKAIDCTAYKTVSTVGELEEWVARIKERGVVAVDTETDSLDAMVARLVGVSLALAPGDACYIPLLHGQTPEGFDFGDGAEIAPDQIPADVAKAFLKPIFEDPAILKIGQNLKYDMLVLAQHGINLVGIDDTMLLSYALDAGKHSHGMDVLSKEHLGHTPIPFKEVAGTGKAQKTFDQIEIPKATEYAAEDADVTWRLHALLKPRLVSERKTTLYETMERPLVPVLVGMERNGIKVDRAVLSRLSGEFAQKMASIEVTIYELADQEFNIASPKQLGEILFDKMGISGGKKTKTGAWSTDAATLEDLAGQGHELPSAILEWRGLAKLKSTYTDALPTFINEQTGRVHTSYSMAGTTTGRLASSDPNLQNIPVRTEDGRRIRTAFVADEGNKLISADYSQVELRLLAHIANVPELKQAFADGIDIHALTASEIFGVPVDGMDPAMRRRAKAINFGIIYGISAFGLANQLGISRTEAGEYIDLYFSRFPGIRTYMDETKAFAHENGYVETIFGRRIHLNEINSKNGARRSFQERAAINAPIQGAAADIIRRAMIAMPGALKEANSQARMLLQVHDELIFEVPAEDADATCKLVSRVMSGAAEPAVHLSVPLDVEACAADNWDEAH